MASPARENVAIVRLHAQTSIERSIHLDESVCWVMQAVVRNRRDRESPRQPDSDEDQSSAPPHRIPFALLEVGFVGRIVGVHVAFNLDMSSDGVKRVNSN